MDSEFRKVESNLTERIEDCEQHFEMLLQNFRQEVHQIVKRLTLSIDQHHQERRNYLDRQFQETRDLIKNLMSSTEGPS